MARSDRNAWRPERSGYLPGLRTRPKLQQRKGRGATGYARWQIAAALVRNGRAPWRLIAEVVLGQQERTVARSGNKLLESGAVRINTFVNPAAVSSRTAFLLHIQAAPGATISVFRESRPQ
jgi:hypothetical protein